MKTVACPTCQRPVAWSPDSPFRPFCSERCRLIDLGAWASVAMVCMIFVSLLNAGQAYLAKPAIDDVFINKGTKKLLLLPIAIILVFLIKGTFDYAQAYLMNFAGIRVVADLREKLYNHLQDLSLSFFTKMPTGILISRITNDVNLIQASVSNVVTGLLKDVFTILGLTGVVFYRNWKLAIFAFLVFPIVIIPITQFGRRLQKFSHKSLQRMGSITTLLHQTMLAGSSTASTDGLAAASVLRRTQKVMALRDVRASAHYV